MSLVLETETPPLYEDETGAIRVGKSRVLLEIVIRAFNRQGDKYYLKNYDRY